ncbi:MAG: VCBS repeat-containing protein [Calditrichaeota bacterium]|nr:VCBS repeat-containing protein [Calditrichota bacterium]
MVDIDNDGDMDLFVGEEFGVVNFYLRNEDGTLSAQENLQSGDNPLDVGGRSAPHVLDWDADGDWDMLIGTATGNFILVINEGTPEEHEFVVIGNLQVEGQDIRVQSEATCTTGDLDGDGLFDLVVGSVNGRLQYFHNIGEVGDPIFDEYVFLFDVNDEIYVQRYSRPTIVDWDGDENLDIVCGLQAPFVKLFTSRGASSVGDSFQPAPANFSFLENYPEPFNGSTTLTFECSVPQHLKMQLFNPAGKLIQSNMLGEISPGQHSLNLTMTQFPAGRYYIVLNNEVQAVGKSITLLK